MGANRWVVAAALALVAQAGCRPAGDAARPAAAATPQAAAAVAGNPPGPAAPGPEAGNPTSCVEGFDPEADYFPDKARPRHARQFRVEYRGHYKVVTVSEPWQGADSSLRYLLVQCGTPVPAGYDAFEVIEVPARSLITTSTTELPHVVRLGLTDRLLGHDEFDWVSSPEIRRRIESGAMIEVGSAPAINVERVVETGADLLLIDSFGEPGLDLLGKLREIAVPVALAPSFLETTALGRAEWIRYTALFFNREREAERAFAEVEERYAEIVRTVRERAPARPTVFTGAPIGEVWHVPGGRSFFALMLADAGGRYLWAEDDSTGSLPLSIESVFERAHDADVWLHPSTMASLDEVRAFDERFARVAAFRAGKVWNNDARRSPAGGNDYWETGTSRPDLVLADLVEIFHPGLLEGHELVFHRRLDAAGRDD